MTETAWWKPCPWCYAEPEKCRWECPKHGFEAIVSGTRHDDMPFRQRVGWSFSDFQILLYQHRSRKEPVRKGDVMITCVGVCRANTPTCQLVQLYVNLIPQDLWNWFLKC
jgi:hypothetical protein